MINAREYLFGSLFSLSQQHEPTLECSWYLCGDSPAKIYTPEVLGQYRVSIRLFILCEEARVCDRRSYTYRAGTGFGPETRPRVYRYSHNTAARLNIEIIYSNGSIYAVANQVKMVYFSRWIAIYTENLLNHFHSIPSVNYLTCGSIIIIKKVSSL